LLPYNEQGDRVRIGEFVLVKVLLDVETRRIYASALVNRHLARTRPPYRAGDEVALIIADESPLGYNAIVDHRYRGLLYHTNLAGPLTAGASMRGFVKSVREDDKIDLSLDEAGYARVAPLAEVILDELARVGGRLNFDDSSDPEAIRARFGVSKKAFKQAIGALYRERRIRFTEPGIELVQGGEG
jgi:predicted RNA-binding protein (virulence factor B family)